MFRLGVVIPVYGRKFITEMVLDYYSNLNVEGVSVTYLVVASPGDPMYSVWKEYDRITNFYVVSASNKPLSDKFNYGVNMLSSNGFDAISVFGSDDLANANYIQEAARLVQRGYDFVSSTGIVFFDWKTGRAFYTGAMSVGACSFLSTRMIHVFKDSVFQPNRDCGVDSQFKHRCYLHGITRTSTIDVTPETPAMIVDIKTPGENVNNYEPMAHAFANRATSIDAKAFFDKYFPGIFNKFSHADYI